MEELAYCLCEYQRDFMLFWQLTTDRTLLQDEDVRCLGTVSNPTIVLLQILLLRCMKEIGLGMEGMITAKGRGVGMKPVAEGKPTDSPRKDAENENTGKTALT